MFLLLYNDKNKELVEVVLDLKGGKNERRINRNKENPDFIYHIMQ